MKKTIIAALSSLVAVFMFAVVANAATSTVIVTGDTSAGQNQPGWMFNRDPDNAIPFEFNEDEASIGAGSLYVFPITNTVNGNADKFIAENFINAPIADISSISYDFMIGSGGDASDKNKFYMSVYANFGESDDDKFYDCRYSVAPTTGSTTDWTTVTFDPTQVYPVATHGTSPFACPSVPADMDLSSAGSTIRVFSLNVGDTSANDTGLDGYLDNVVVSIAGDTTINDFEPALTPSDKNECKNGGWMTFNTPMFDNQGQCVSYVQANENAGKRSN